MHITGITVTYNTKSLIQRALDSIRKYYDFDIMVVDGSEADNECAKYLQERQDIELHRPGYNIGHGKGMNIALNCCKTQYALVFDSDIELIKENIVEEMLSRCNNDTYGIGELCYMDVNGRNAKDGMKYLHPYFMLINVEQYLKWHPFVHHGAPCYKTMLEINRAGKADILLNIHIKNHVRHDWKGTRNLKPKEFLTGWQ